MEIAKFTRAGFYVDGCNLFHGMRECKQREYYWLDLAALANEFLKENQVVSCVKYFTARVIGDPGKNKRHSTYIDALNVYGKVTVIEGAFQPEPFRCSNCHNRRSVPKEKQTDTNIATSMVIDAFIDLWDVAFLISGDADLVPPIKGIRKHFPQKSVFVIHHPARTSSELKKAASHVFYVNQAMLSRCQLPPEVPHPEVTLKRPDKWK